MNLQINPVGGSGGMAIIATSYQFRLLESDLPKTDLKGKKAKKFGENPGETSHFSDLL